MDLVGGCACTVECSTRIVANGMSVAAAMLSFMNPLLRIERPFRFYRFTGPLPNQSCSPPAHEKNERPKAARHRLSPNGGGSESIAEAQLQDPHKPRLARD